MRRVDVAGHKVAVTGGARGIGREIARAFAAAGAQVAIGDVDVELARTTAVEIGSGTVPFRLDVTNEASLAAFIGDAEAQLGTLDVFVNNAGIMPIGPFLDEPAALTRRTIEVDVNALLTATRLAGARFHARGRGHIVNIASFLGTTAVPNAATYCAAKYAAVGLGQALRQEWRGTGVKITTICPSYVRTELIAGLPASRLTELITIEPHDVARAVVKVVRVGSSGQVFVPARAGVASRLAAAMPGQLRDTLFRWAGGEAATRVNSAERAGYQSRIAPPSGRN